MCACAWTVLQFSIATHNPGSVLTEPSFWGGGLLYNPALERPCLSTKCPGSRPLSDFHLLPADPIVALLDPPWTPGERNNSTSGLSMGGLGALRSCPCIYLWHLCLNLAIRLLRGDRQLTSEAEPKNKNSNEQGTGTKSTRLVSGLISYHQAECSREPLYKKGFFFSKEVRPICDYSVNARFTPFILLNRTKPCNTTELRRL